jgi:hypothetical protein
MSRRLRLLVAATAAFGCLGVFAQSASAWVYTDVRWALGESTTTYGGGTQFHISTDGDGSAYYRWMDADMTKTTVISGNNCGDYSLIGNTTITGGDTSYHRLFFGFPGLCFVLRGRTTGGTTITHDGRVRR